MKKHFDEGILKGQISSGVDYYKGEPGEDGVSPIITVEEIAGGHRVIITDAEGEKSFDVMDGEGNGEMIVRNAEIAYNYVDVAYRWQTIVNPDFTGVNDFYNTRVSLKATFNDVSHPYSMYLTLYPNKPGTAFCGFLDGCIFTLTKIGQNWQGGCYEWGKLSNRINEAQSTADNLAYNVGDLLELQTMDQSSIVNAVNEVYDMAQGGSYTLPTATTSTLGGVKIDGSTITINNGVISAVSATAPQPVSYSAGTGINIDNNVISADTSILAVKSELPAAQVNSDWNSSSGVSAILNKPSIPANVSDLNNDAGYITSSAIPVLSVNSQTGNVVLSIPEAQVNSDWNSTSGVSAILNKPSIPSYTAGYGIVIENDEIMIDDVEIARKVDLPTNVSDLTNDAGYITSADIPADFPTYVAGRGIEIYEDVENTIAVALGDGLTDVDNAITVDAGDGLTFDGSQLVVDFNTVASTTYVASAINAIPTYTLPTATTSTLGGVKVDGSSITIDANGVISSTGSSWDLSDRLLAGTTGTGSIREGDVSQNIATGDYSHAEGILTQATGAYSHAEGWQAKAWGNSSHAEGSGSKAGSVASHAEGYSTYAQGDYCHAEGMSTTANSVASHAEGNGTITSSSYQHAEGMFNVEDNKGIFQNIVGNGADKNNRSNSFARDWSGNEYLAGNLYVGCNAYSTTSGGLITANAGGSKVATESYVDTAISSVTATYTLPTATTSTLGGVKVDGSTITIDANGVISSSTSGGGASYSAGNGIVISNNVISTSSNVAEKEMIRTALGVEYATDLTTYGIANFAAYKESEENEGEAEINFYGQYASNEFALYDYAANKDISATVNQEEPTITVRKTEGNPEETTYDLQTTIDTQHIEISNPELSSEVKTASLYTDSVEFLVDNQEDGYQPYEGLYGSGGLSITMREPTEDFDQTGEVYETFISITPEHIEFNSDVNRVNGQLAIGVSGDLEWNGEPILPSAPSTGTYMLTSTSGNMAWTAITVGGNY